MGVLCLKKCLMLQFRHQMIRSSGKRLEKLKTLDYEGLNVWKTISEMNYPLSGAVHGMAGIAEALYMADVRLGTDEFAASAHDALLFEDMTYSEKLGGWEDRRVPGVHKLSCGNMSFVDYYLETGLYEAAGIGYELLRYAAPSTLLTIL